MDTVTAILLTQLPIAVAILIGTYQLHKIKKELLEILEKLAEKVNKQ
jgi:hypothetical protein